MKKYVILGFFKPKTRHRRRLMLTSAIAYLYFKIRFLTCNIRYLRGKDES